MGETMVPIKLEDALHKLGGLETNKDSINKDTKDFFLNRRRKNFCPKELDIIISEFLVQFLSVWYVTLLFKHPSLTYFRWFFLFQLVVNFRYSFS